jgi:hypothetical protein
MQILCATPQKHSVLGTLCNPYGRNGLPSLQTGRSDLQNNKADSHQETGSVLTFHSKIYNITASGSSSSQM